MASDEKDILKKNDGTAISIAKDTETLNKLDEVAIEAGYSGIEQVQSPNGFLGELLIKNGIITQEQATKILQAQQDLRKSGVSAPRFGDVAVDKGFCTEQQVEDAINSADSERKRLKDPLEF